MEKGACKSQPTLSKARETRGRRENQHNENKLLALLQNYPLLQQQGEKKGEIRREKVNKKE